MPRPELPENRKRVHITATVSPETMRRIKAAAEKHGLAIGAVIDDLVSRNPAYFRDTG
jgi:hypothetical protein